MYYARMVVKSELTSLVRAGVEAGIESCLTIHMGIERKIANGLVKVLRYAVCGMRKDTSLILGN